MIQLFPFPLPSLHDWIDYGRALLTPTLWLLTAILAYAHWRTQQDKIKFVLFDRRWATYVAALDLVAAMGRFELAAPEKLTLPKDFGGAKWLFNTNIDAYLKKELWARATQLNIAAKILASSVSDEAEKREWKTKYNKILDWIPGQYEALDDMFAPYIQFNTGRQPLSQPQEKERLNSPTHFWSRKERDYFLEDK